MAVVAVDWKRLASARRTSISVWLRLHWDPPLTGETVTAALASVELPSAVVHIPVQLTGPLPLPDGGALLNITEMVSLAKLRQFVAGVEEALAPHGGTLRIEPLRQQNLRLPDHFPHIAVSASLPWRPDARDRWIERRAESERRASYWFPTDMDVEARNAALQVALDWCNALGPGGSAWFSDSFWPYPLDASAAQHAVHAAVTRGHYNVGYTYLHPEHGVRSVTLETMGRLLFNVGWPPGPVRLTEAATTLSGLLRDLVPHITSAVALNSQTWVASTDFLINWTASPTMPVNASNLGKCALLSDRRLIDAYGLLYLGPGFAGLAEHPQHYRTIPLADGRVLMHHEVDAWLRTAEPDEAMRESARADLADLVLTPEDVRAEHERFGAP